MVIDPLFTSILSTEFQQDFNTLTVSAVALEGIYKSAMTESEEEREIECDIVPSLTDPEGTVTVQENGAVEVLGVTETVVSQQIEDNPEILLEMLSF